MRKLGFTMRGLRVVPVVMAMLGLMALPANADLIHFETFTLEDPIGSPSEELAFVQAKVGDPNLVFLAKIENGGEDGAVSASLFDVTLNGNTADVEWDLTGTGFGLNWVLVKDGTVDTNGQDHLYSLWQATADQFLTSNGPQTVGFLDNGNFIEKDISHLTFMGSTAVAEPGTLALLGAGLVSFGLWGRRRFKK